MPLVRISLRQGTSREYRKAIGDGVHRTDAVVFVQITLSTGRRPQQKRLLYKRMAEILAESPGLRPQDLFINLVEVS